MGKLSRDKGKRGELEIVHKMKDHGYEARRGQQFRGTKDSPDVIHNMEGFAVEVKFVETFSVNDLYATLAKQQEDAASGEDAIVFHRRKNKPWIVVMDADRFLNMAKDLFDDNN